MAKGSKSIEADFALRTRMLARSRSCPAPFIPGARSVKSNANAFSRRCAGVLSDKWIQITTRGAWPSAPAVSWPVSLPLLPAIDNVLVPQCAKPNSR